MDVLIIGGSRFVGPYLVRRLLKNNHRVSLFNRGLISSEYKDVIFIKGDRNNGFSIKHKFDVVIDMCAYDGKQTEMAISQLDFKFFINIGTAASYKKTELFPLNETSSLGDWPLWGRYNKGKVDCERVLSKSGISFATIRPVYILGPHNYCNREYFIYSRIRQGISLVLPGNGQALVQFVFARDVADCIAMIAERKEDGAFNCAGDDLITLRGLVEEMGEVVGREPHLQFNQKTDGQKFDENEFPFANENLVCTNDKIKSLGIRFTPLLKGLKDDYVKHYSKTS